MSSTDIDAPPGFSGSSSELFTQLYEELRRLAASSLRRVGAQGLLSPTTVLHEAYLDICGGDGPLATQFPDRARFMGYASRAMRGLIIDYARRQQAQKRGGEFHLTALPAEAPEVRADTAELDRLAEAMEELSGMDARLVEVVDLKYFCGFSFGEIAAMRNLSERTVQRDWEKARMLLHRALREEQRGA